MNEPELQETVEGVVESLIFYNAENGYTVFSITPDDAEQDELVCVGNMERLSVGEHVKLTGGYRVHPTYGRQLNVSFCEKNIPDTETGIERYLASGAIKGVKAKLAKKIVAHFGTRTLEVIEEYPEQLASIRGITLERAMSISAVFHEQAELRRAVMYLQEMGISYAHALKMYKKYGVNTIDILRDNPYALADEIIGIGFKTADAIAFKMGVDAESPYRIKCAVRYVLNQASGNGHCYLPKKILLGMAAELLDLAPELIENEFIQMQMNRTIVQEGRDENTAIFLNFFHRAENYTAVRLLELSRLVMDKSAGTREQIEKLERENNIILAENQKRAVVEAMANGVLVITGGPGTGKTTTIKTIIHMLTQSGSKIELAAPTGRAAKRMTEATGKEARTIHRLLEIAFVDDERQGRGQVYGKNEDNPLEADVVIIDESSMVDIGLMSALLHAIPDGTRLILVGDVDQLPSVGPGNVLKDIIGSDCVPVIRLQEVFRQAQESAIVMNAHRINHGEPPLINEKNKDFFFMRRALPEQIVSTVLELVQTRLPRYANCNSPHDIQVLTPMRKSPVGLIHLNEVLQKALNPPRFGKKEKETRGIVFREGDKVMQIKNNYGVTWRSFENGKQIDEGLGVFNGDMGIIQRINLEDEEMEVLFDDNKLVAYDFSRLDELELAYAITIHKSQGSEYKIVVLPIYSGPPMLMSRNLLYTGITRAKELAVMVGVPEVMEKMVENNREVNRYTALQNRMKKLHEGFAEMP